jgi:hypothetical protein
MVINRERQLAAFPRVIKAKALERSAESVFATSSRGQGFAKEAFAAKEND